MDTPFSRLIKYLSVLLDSDLSWKSQTNAIAVKLKRANGALARIRHLVPKYVLLQVYYSVFHSHLQYCCQIWGQSTCSLIECIASLQNSAIRLMSFETQWTPSSPLYTRFRILKMPDIVHLQNIMLFIVCTITKRLTQFKILSRLISPMLMTHVPIT